MSARVAWGFTSDPADTWRDRAACLDEDPERFFPTDIESHGPLTVEAKAFCRVFCQVADECLAWALRHGIDHGVWGGATPAERRGYRRRRERVLAEQFPPVAELVRELPGVADRPRRTGRPVMTA